MTDRRQGIAETLGMTDEQLAKTEERALDALHEAAAPRTPTRWWISWVQVATDVRPERWPPPDDVLGFWGDENGPHADPKRDGEERTIVYALVEADGPREARGIVEMVWNVAAWRFCRQRLDDSPPGGRFAPPEWSVEMGRWPWPT